MDVIYALDTHSICRASVGITFYLNQAHSADMTIPAFTQVKTADNIAFYTTADLVIPIGQTRGTVMARNAVAITYQQINSSTGQPNQQFEIAVATAYNSASVRVGGINYTSKETFAYSLSTDRHFIETVNENGVPIIRFGDGFMGIIPGNGATIEVAYEFTNGSTGNVSSGLINTIVSTLTLPSGITVTCNNLIGATGGTSIETLDELKRRIPLSNKVKMRAVTAQDYIDLAQTYPSVSKAGVQTNCGSAIQLYIVPSGGGVASTQLLNDVSNYFDDKKILGRQLDVLPAGEVKTKYTITVKSRADYAPTAVYDAVKANIIAFQSYQNQEISGRVELSDIYQIIEDTEGVISSKIEVMTTIPFARPQGTWQTLDWSVTTLAASSATVKWRLEFVTVSTYQLFRNDSYVGTYAVGVQVTKVEVQFTVNANYAIGDKFSFVTYPYFGTIQLDEPSVPVAYTGDINISAY